MKKLSLRLIGSFILLMQWPIILTLVMFSILVFMYKRLARSEEKEVLTEFGEEYSHYMAEVPRFIPNFG